MFQELGSWVKDLLAPLQTGPIVPTSLSMHYTTLYTPLIHPENHSSIISCILLAVQKSQDIFTGTFSCFAPVAFSTHPFIDMTTIIQNLGGEFSARLKTK